MDSCQEEVEPPWGGGCGASVGLHGGLVLAIQNMQPDGGIFSIGRAARVPAGVSKPRLLHQQVTDRVLGRLGGHGHAPSPVVVYHLVLVVPVDEHRSLGPVGDDTGEVDGRPPVHVDLGGVEDPRPGDFLLTNTIFLLPRDLQLWYGRGDRAIHNPHVDNITQHRFGRHLALVAALVCRRDTSYPQYPLQVWLVEHHRHALVGAVLVFVYGEDVEVVEADPGYRLIINIEDPAGQDRHLARLYGHIPRKSLVETRSWRRPYRRCVHGRVRRTALVRRAHWIHAHTPAVLLVGPEGKPSLDHLSASEAPAVGVADGVVVVLLLVLPGLFLLVVVLLVVWLLRVVLFGLFLLVVLLLL